MAHPEFSVLIVDDEPAARLGVRQLLTAFPEFRVVGECRNGREALEWLDRVATDVVFLDIQMPEVSGFEVVQRRTAERMPATVFLTAYDQFALQAFDAQALDYLVKPVSERRFASTMRRVLRQLRGPTHVAVPEFAVPTARGMLFVRLDQVDWIEAADNYVRLWVGTRGYLLREALDAVEARVSHHGFARAHRNALVQIGRVRELSRGAGNELVATLTTGIRIPVARRRRAQFSHALLATTARETGE
jgi:two-component system, LytTR family, response regulator